MTSSKMDVKIGKDFSKLCGLLYNLEAATGLLVWGVLIRR